MNNICSRNYLTIFTSTVAHCRQCVCVLETQRCSLVSLILEIKTSMGSQQQRGSCVLSSINHVKTIIVKMQIFKLELVNVTGIDNKIYMSKATAHNVLPHYNGTDINCMDGGDQTNSTMTL